MGQAAQRSLKETHVIMITPARSNLTRNLCVVLVINDEREITYMMVTHAHGTWNNKKEGQKFRVRPGCSTCNESWQASRAGRTRREGEIFIIRNPGQSESCCFVIVRTCPESWSSPGWPVIRRSRRDPLGRGSPSHLNI